MEQHPIQNDVRRARRQRKLGPNAVCVLCGFRAPEGLCPVKRSFLEGHHVAGLVNDPDLLVPLCLNCHTIQSELQRVRGVALRHDAQRTLLEVLATVLQELARFCKAVGERLEHWAARLRTFIAALDRAWPAWRELPEAQT